VLVTRARDLPETSFCDGPTVLRTPGMVFLPFHSHPSSHHLGCVHAYSADPAHLMVGANNHDGWGLNMTLLSRGKGTRSLHIAPLCSLPSARSLRWWAGSKAGYPLEVDVNVPGRHPHCHQRLFLSCSVWPFLSTSRTLHILFSRFLRVLSEASCPRGTKALGPFTFPYRALVARCHRRMTRYLCCAILRESPAFNSISNSQSQLL
jgi:hypothetical protein